MDLQLFGTGFLEFSFSPRKVGILLEAIVIEIATLNDSPPCVRCHSKALYMSYFCISLLGLP